MKSRAPAVEVTTAADAFEIRPAGTLAWALVALVILVAGLIFVQRLHRPL